MCQRQSGIRRKLLTKELNRRIRTKKNETIENAKRNLPAAETKKLSEKNGTGLKAVLPAGCVVWGKVRVCPAPNAGLPGNAASCL